MKLKKTIKIEVTMEVSATHEEAMQDAINFALERFDKYMSGAGAGTNGGYGYKFVSKQLIVEKD